MYKKWKLLNIKTDEKSKKEYQETEKLLAQKYAKEYFEKIKKQTENIDCEDSAINYGKLWNLKKDLFPNSRDPPTAMVDPTTGNLLTSEDKIKDAAVDVFSKRLETKPIREDLKHVQDAKELLCTKLLQVPNQTKLHRRK